MPVTPTAQSTAPVSGPDASTTTLIGPPSSGSASGAGSWFKRKLSKGSPHVSALESRGYSRTDAERALKRTGGNLEQAEALLVKGTLKEEDEEREAKVRELVDKRMAAKNGDFSQYAGTSSKDGYGAPINTSYG